MGLAQSRRVPSEIDIGVVKKLEAAAQEHPDWEEAGEFIRDLESITDADVDAL